MKIYFDNILIDQQYYKSITNDYYLFTDTFYLGSTACNTFNIIIDKRAVSFQPNSVILKDENDNFIANLVVDNINEMDDESYSYSLIDRMIDFEFRYNASEIINNSNSGKVSLYEILTNICEKAGISLALSSLENECDVSWYDNTITAREYIGYIAELQGKYAYIDNDGKLNFSLYKKTPSKIITFNQIGDYKIGEYHKISRVVYEMGDIKYEYGQDVNDTLYINSNNPFIINTSQINYIYEVIKDFEFYSFEVKKCIIDYDVKAGNIITFKNDNLEYPTIAQYSLTYNNGWIGGYSLNIKSKKQENTTNIGLYDEVKRLRIEVNRDLNKITHTVENINTQIIDLSKYTDTKNGNEVEINNKTGNEIKVNSVVLKGRTKTITTENIFNKNTMSERINAYINTNSKWVYAEDSYSIRVPVKPNTKLTINMDNTNESLFRFGFVKTDDIPTSTTTVDIYDAVRLTRPVHMPQELYVGSDARYLIIQMGAGQALTTIDSLSIKEEKLKSINGMKNLFDGEFENGIVNYITGNKSSNTTLIRSKNYIEVKPNTNYKFSGVDYDYTSVYVYEYDKDLNFIQYLVNNEVSQHAINFANYLTTSNNTKYILFRPPGVITNTNFKIQMEEGTVATEYAPRGQIAIKRVNNSQEQKIYIDLQGNELTEYDKLFIENDRAIIQKKSRHLSLAIIDMNNSEDYPGWKNLTQLKEDFPSSNNYFSLITNYISNIGLMSDNRISINTNQTGVLFLSKYYNNNLTQTQWKEQHPSLVLDLYYELDTPYEIDLGQIEMPTILSNKNYFSNSEDANMSINYFTNYEMYQMYYENEKKFNELDSKTNDLANEGNEIRKDLNNNYTNNSELEQKLDNQKQEIKTEMSTTISQTKESWQAEVLEYINKNGVEKFVNMLVTIDIDGLKLSKSDEDIVSLLNNKGLYVSDGKLREDLSNLLMKVDRAGALFKILEILGTIKEQNIIQKEVIEDTKYGTCQAWYWIGGDN